MTKFRTTATRHTDATPEDSFGHYFSMFPILFRHPCRSRIAIAPPIWIRGLSVKMYRQSIFKRSSLTLTLHPKTDEDLLINPVLGTDGVTLHACVGKGGVSSFLRPSVAGSQHSLLISTSVCVQYLCKLTLT